MKNSLLTALLILLSIASNAQSRVIQHVISSTNLSEDRIITVSLPEDYNSATHSYPVLYVLDGEYAFSYACGSVDFLSNDFGYLPEMIVVGIPNTNRYRDMFVTMNEDDAYMSFIRFVENEVFPFIAENYRANDFRLLYGWSSASGIGIYLLATRPQLMDGYILTGTGIGPRSAELFRNTITDDSFNNTYLYAGTEDEEPRRSALIRFKEIFHSLDPVGLKYRFDILEGSDHVDVIATGLYEGLQFIFEDFYIPDSVTLNGSEAIIAYYQSLSEMYDFTVQIPEGAVNESASVLLNNDQKDEAIRLLEMGMELYPHSATLPGSLGEIHQYDSDTEGAWKYYQMALDRSKDNPTDQLKFQTLLNELKSN